MAFDSDWWIHSFSFRICIFHRFIHLSRYVSTIVAVGSILCYIRQDRSDRTSLISPATKAGCRYLLLFYSIPSSDFFNISGSEFRPKEYQDRVGCKKRIWIGYDRDRIVRYINGSHFKFPEADLFGLIVLVCLCLNQNVTSESTAFALERCGTSTTTSQLILTLLGACVLRNWSRQNPYGT
jgi:hypothetical protein